LDKNFLNFYVNELNYSRLGFFANSLILNKKMYLLYKIFNKKTEFIFLKNKKKNNRLDKNILILASLNSINFKKFYINTKFFDYFYKSSSSFIKRNDVLVNKFFDNNNKKKNLISSLESLDYSIGDNIYLNYLINKKTKFFYFFKNNIFFDFLFKLRKNNKMKFKYYYFFYIYMNLSLLNTNYYLLLSVKF
jgi:hypothetical protein